MRWPCDLSDFVVGAEEVVQGLVRILLHFKIIQKQLTTLIIAVSSDRLLPLLYLQYLLLLATWIHIILTRFRARRRKLAIALYDVALAVLNLNFLSSFSLLFYCFEQFRTRSLFLMQSRIKLRMIWRIAMKFRISHLLLVKWLVCYEFCHVIGTNILILIRRTINKVVLFWGAGFHATGSAPMGLIFNESAHLIYLSLRGHTQVHGALGEGIGRCGFV